MQGVLLDATLEMEVLPHIAPVLALLIWDTPLVIHKHVNSGWHERCVQVKLDNTSGLYACVCMCVRPCALMQYLFLCEYRREGEEVCFFLPYYT